MDKERQIGGVEMFMEDGLVRYEIEYLVPEKELGTVIPKIGDNAQWAGNGAVVKNVKKTFLAPGAWLVRITAEKTESSSRINFGISSSTLNSYRQKNYTNVELYFDPAWFGMRIAKVSDCPPMLPGKTYPEDGLAKFKNIRNSWAFPGEFIFFNALPLLVSENGQVTASEATSGEATYELSPFHTSGHPATALAGQTVSLILYSCSFCTRRSPGDIGAFVGVSGAFGNSCSPKTGSQAGRWKAVSQNLSTVTTNDGDVYTLVKRSMVSAPGSSKWLASEINGGTWSW